MKNYIRNTINISCAKIVLPSVIENGPSPIIYTPKDNEPDETHYLWKVLEFSISKYVFFFVLLTPYRITDVSLLRLCLRQVVCVGTAGF